MPRPALSTGDLEKVVAELWKLNDANAFLHPKFPDTSRDREKKKNVGGFGWWDRAGKSHDLNEAFGAKASLAVEKQGRRQAHSPAEIKEVLFFSFLCFCTLGAHLTFRCRRYPLRHRCKRRGAPTA
jgi:hypothetical protein